MRILIVDDHAVVRTALGCMLAEQPDLEIVGEAANGQQAIDRTKTLHPDLVLMDINMPVMNGIEATRAIAVSSPATRVIGLSMFETLEQAQAMQAAGASHYVSKSGSTGTLLAAIRTAVGRAPA